MVGCDFGAHSIVFFARDVGNGGQSQDLWLVRQA